MDEERVREAEAQIMQEASEAGQELDIQEVRAQLLTQASNISTLAFLQERANINVTPYQANKEITA